MSLVEGLPSRRSLVSGPSVPTQSGLLEAIADWCGCLQGGLPLMSALEHLAEALGARTVCLSRHTRAMGGPGRAVIFNARSITRLDIAVSRSFAQCVLGRYVGRARPASVWFSSSGDEQDDPALEVFQERAGIAETVVVALALEDKWADYLEIHFARAPSSDAKDLLTTLAGTLSRTWIRRTPGLFADAILARQANARAGVQEPILSFVNPARLSRAEFRVCRLLSRGLNTTSVCSELSISPSTLKSHLRSIFAKTEVTSMAELLYLLLAPRVNERQLIKTTIVRRA